MAAVAAAVAESMAGGAMVAVLTVLTVLTVLRVPIARAELPSTRAQASLSLYTDDDHVTVVSPAASATQRIADRAAVEAAVTVDSVTAASIDVVSQATLHGFEETRLEGTVGLIGTPFAALQRLELTGRVTGSTESDYDALTLQLVGQYDDAAHRNTVRVGYAAGRDVVGHVLEPGFGRSRRSDRLSVTLSRIATRALVIDVGVDTTLMSGYLANPYRYVPIAGPGARSEYALPERVPDTRWMLSALGRVRLAVSESPGVYLHGEYRLYVDDWGIVSHMLRARCIVALVPRWLEASTEVRAYGQSGAAFYERSYVDRGEGPPSLRSRDRTLGGMSSLTGELTLTLSLDERGDQAPHVLMSVSAMRFSWTNYALQRNRNALAMTVGASLPF